VPPAYGPLARLSTIVLHLVAEIVAPTCCVSCESPVAPRVLFCPACAPSVLPAIAPPAGHHAVFDYGGAVATAIVRLKYAGRSDLAARFADVMAQAAAEIFDGDRGEGFEVVVPVPLHPKRLVERGFDQASLLAAPVARRLGVAHSPRALVRTRETPPQASLDRAARSANVEDAFRCPSPRHIERRRVLLVDDVRTTGATLRACADTLREAGARDVQTLVLAHRERAEKVQKTPKYED
jgi:ComF family protein